MWLLNRDFVCALEVIGIKWRGLLLLCDLLYYTQIRRIVLTLSESNTLSETNTLSEIRLLGLNLLVL